MKTLNVKCDLSMGNIMVNGPKKDLMVHFVKDFVMNNFA